MTKKNVDISNCIGRSILTRSTILSVSLSMKRSVPHVIRNGIRPSVTNQEERTCATCNAKMKTYRCSINSHPWIIHCPNGCTN